jgi:hypothetical protein
MCARGSWWSADVMAKIYPEKYVGKEGAEKRFFELIKALKSSQWTFFHSVDLARHSEKRNGEIDFIAVSRTALFTIEVKGGKISRRSGVWYANGNEMDESPLKQSKENYFAFDKYIKKSRTPRLPGGSCCAWPDADFGTSSGEWELNCVMDKTRCASLLESLQAAECHFRDEATRLGRPTPTLNEAEYAQLCGSILPDVVAAKSASEAISQDKTDLIQLSKSQVEVLDRIEGNPRMLISGPAGSGKTILAYEACKRTLKEHPNWHGAYVCQSYYLAKDILARSWNDKLDERLHILSDETIASFYFEHALGLNLEKDFKEIRADIKIPRFDSIPEKISFIKPRNLLDFIVVDEGQDVRNDLLLFTLLNSCVKRGLKECRLMWFEDPLQSISQIVSPDKCPGDENMLKINAELLGNCFRYNLDKANYRNPKKISDIAGRLIGNPIPAKFEGNLRDQFVTVDSNEPIEALSGIIMQLSRQGIGDNDIVVISVNGASVPSLKKNMLLGGKRLSHEPSEYTRSTIGTIPPDTIRWTRLIDVKGREFPVVILIDLPSSKDRPDCYLSYVAVTRATSLLIAVGSNNQLSQLG